MNPGYWLEALKANPKAMARIEGIVNRTATSEDGETLFISLDDAAEVYTILFMAVTDGERMLEGLFWDSRQRAINEGVGLLKVESEMDDEIKFAPVEHNASDKEIIIAANWA